jgi:hypothetical protein
LKVGHYTISEGGYTPRKANETMDIAEWDVTHVPQQNSYLRVSKMNMLNRQWGYQVKDGETNEERYTNKWTQKQQECS